LIKSLHIKNFQSHRDSLLEFVPGINIIVGKSDAGKSAIIRALRWVIWNKPSGDSFRSWLGGDPGVELNVDDNKIVRFRSSSKNIYELNGLKFEAFETDVPKAIQEVLNFNDVNLQRQLDTHYLLTNTPGEIAQHFNRIAHLDQIDRGLSNIRSWIDEINRNIRAKNTEITNKEAQLKDFDYLPALEQEVLQLEALQQKEIQTQQRLEQLRQWIDEIERIDIEIEKEAKIFSLEPILNETLVLLQKRNENTSKVKKLIELREEIEYIEKEIKEHQKILSLETLLNDTLSLIEKRKVLEMNQGKMLRLSQEFQDVEDRIHSTQLAIDRWEQLFNELMPDVCPLCGQPFKKQL